MIIALNVFLAVSGNEEITKGLLNSIMDTEIKEVKLECKETLDKDIYSDKVGILDIKAKLNDEMWCDIELQVIDERNIEKRMLFYWSKMYNTQLKSGENYRLLKKTVVILIADYELKQLQEIRSPLTKWEIREKDNSEIVLTKDLEFYILEMPKVTKYNGLNKTLINWVKFIKNPEVLTMEDYEENESLKKAKDALDDFNEEDEEDLMAAKRIMAIADKMAIEEAGFDKGMETKKIEITKKMLKKSMDINEISEITGLSIEEIEKLKEI